MKPYAWQRLGCMATRLALVKCFFLLKRMVLFPGLPGFRKDKIMTNKTERLQNAELADLLSKWRESDDPEDKQQLARYGRDHDLDKLVGDPDDDVRYAIA